MSYDERVLDLADMDYDSAAETLRYIDRLKADRDRLRDAGNAVAAAFDTAVQLDYGGNPAATSASRLVSREISAWRSAAGSETR